MVTVSELKATDVASVPWQNTSSQPMLPVAMRHRDSGCLRQPDAGHGKAHNGFH
jgi:hypothetical protein